MGEVGLGPGGGGVQRQPSFLRSPPVHAGDARHRGRVLSALALPGLLGGPDSCPWSSGHFESLLDLLLPLEAALRTLHS